MKKAFIIMQIGDPSLESIYKDVYKPTIKECGLIPIRVDEHNKGGLIKNAIDKYILESELIIADLTNERPNCYLEVGYTYGLKKDLNLILTAREDHFPSSDNYTPRGPRIHFDLNGYPIIPWEIDEIESFKQKLKKEIQNRLGRIEKERKELKKTQKNDNDWFLEHKKKALESLNELENQGYFEINISSENFDRTLRQDKIINSIQELRSIKNSSPFKEAIELDSSQNKEFRWKASQKEIVKKIFDKDYSMLIYWVVRRDLTLFVLNSFSEDFNTRDTLYTDTRIFSLVEDLLFIQKFFKKFNVSIDADLLIKITYGNLKKYKLLTPSQREKKILKEPFITEENEIKADIRVKLKNIDSDIIQIVEDVISQLFIVYDIADYLKNIPGMISNYMKNKISN